MIPVLAFGGLSLAMVPALIVLAIVAIVVLALLIGILSNFSLILVAIGLFAAAYYLRDNNLYKTDKINLSMGNFAAMIGVGVLLVYFMGVRPAGLLSSILGTQGSSSILGQAAVFGVEPVSFEVMAILGIAMVGSLFVMSKIFKSKRRKY